MTTLYLHGLTGTPASFDEIVRGRPSAERTLRPYLSGHGPQPSLAVDFATEIARLRAYLEREHALPPPGEPGIDVIAYSMGARVALGLALAHPAIVARLTLVGASAGIDDARARRDRAIADDGLAAILRTEGLDAFLARWEAQPALASQADLPEPLRARRRAERASHDPDALAAAVAALSKGRMPSLWPRLRELSCPVTLVVGERDEKFVAEASAMAAHIQSARVVVVPGAAHDVVLERPAELLAVLKGASA